MKTALMTLLLLSTASTCLAQEFPQEAALDAEALQAEATSGRFPRPDKKYCNRWPNCVPTHCLPRCFCLQSTFGTYQQNNPNVLRNSGAFKLLGLVRGKGVFTWKGECYSSQMRYTGKDHRFYYYRALRTPYCFAITNSGRYRVMYIYNRCTPGDFQFYQIATSSDCSCGHCHAHSTTSCHVGNSCAIEHGCQKTSCCP